MKALLPEPRALAIPVVATADQAAAAPGRVVSDLAFECLGHVFTVAVRTSIDD
jgi:hypothetical protein